MIQRMDRCYKLSHLLLRRRNHKHHNHHQHHQNQQQLQRRLLGTTLNSTRLFLSQQAQQQIENSEGGDEECSTRTFTNTASSCSINNSPSAAPSPLPLSFSPLSVRRRNAISPAFQYAHNFNFNFTLNQHHCYHTTTKKEILPLIAVGSLAVLGTYGFRALKRMDDEWDEYQEALKEYKLEHGLSDIDIDDGVDDDTFGNSAYSSDRALFKQGTMSIDLGSTNVRIAYLPNANENANANSSNNGNNQKPKVIVNRQGGRSTPNSIIVETDGSTKSGTLAAAKIYERSQSNNPVLNPFTLLMSQQKQQQQQGDVNVDVEIDMNTIKMTTNYALENLLAPLAANALEQAVGGSSSSSSSNRSSSPSSKVLFSVDSLNGVGGYNTQPIFTYPPPNTNSSSSSDGSENESESLYVQLYQDAIKDIISPSSIAKFIPEPICAVKGAKFFNVLPPVSSSPSPSVLVIDIGGSTTSISIVESSSPPYALQYHSRIDNFGGETIIESLMNYLCKSFYDVPTVKSVSDTMGVQRLYDASKDALKEMMGGSKSRVQINIPYLSVDDKMQPKHLDLGVSVKVLEAEFNDYVKDNIVPDVIVPQNLLSSSLSSSGQQPNDLESLFSSMIMKVFETSGQNPFTLNSVLVVGGGARSPMFKNALKASFGKLAGEQFVQERVVFPTGALVEEMVVLGAALSSSD